MANYATISDVNGYVPQSPYTPTTTPTQAQVEAFITQMTNQINLTLINLGYITPVVQGAMALAELKKATAWGALGLAQQSRVTAVQPDQNVGLSVWTKMFRDWMAALADPKNPYELSDAPRTSKAVIKPLGEMLMDPTQSSVDNGTDSDPVSYLRSPTFFMNMKFS